MAKKPIIDWHRLFSIAVEQNFIDYIVLKIERERDLSIKQQYLDLLILYTESYESLTEFLTDPPEPLPDGLDNLSQHNLITYKSLQESLTPWTLQELVRHYVNYRKEETDKFHAEKKQEKKAKKQQRQWPKFHKRTMNDPELDEPNSDPESDKVPRLLPEELFRLYAVCTRYPQNIMDSYATTEIQEGVYEIDGFGLTVRIIVLSRIPKAEHNAIWNIFSNVAENIEFGAKQFEEARKEMSSVLDLLFKRYNQEGVHVAYTLKQFHQDYVMDVVPELLEDENLQTGFVSSIFRKFSVEKVLSLFFQDKQRLYQLVDKALSMSLDDEHLKNLSVKKFFSRLSPSERMEGLSADERVEGLSPDEIKSRLSPSERLEGLSPDEIKSYLEEIENK